MGRILFADETDRTFRSERRSYETSTHYSFSFNSLACRSRQAWTQPLQPLARKQKATPTSPRQKRPTQIPQKASPVKPSQFPLETGTFSIIAPIQSGFCGIIGFLHTRISAHYSGVNTLPSSYHLRTSAFILLILGCVLTLGF